MKKILPLFGISILFAFCLIFPSITLEASKAGLLLWFDSLVPTLLPFLIISQLILKTSLVESIQKMAGPIFRHIFHCSENGSFCLICGFLCGYPVGARLISLQIKDQQLTLEEGQYLLGFCNNVSPMFCISYGISQAIGASDMIPYLLLIYGSAILFGIITRPKYIADNTVHTKKQTPQAESIFQLIDVCIIDSFFILIKLCGYLVLFSIICKGILMVIPSTSIYTVPVIASFLEITNGLSLTGALPKGMIRTVIALASLTFGGLCCIFQTNSVISDTGLSLNKYILHKVVIMLISLCLFFLWYFLNRGSV